jgi:hypothetical protein
LVVSVSAVFEGTSSFNATPQSFVTASATFAGTSSFSAVYIPPPTGIQIPQGNGGAFTGTIPQGNGGAFTGTIPQGAGGAANYQIEKLTQAMLDDAFILGEMDA